MIKFSRQTLLGLWQDVLPVDFIRQLEDTFSRVFDVSQYIPLQVREFIDTTAASVTRNLPDGTKSPDKDYHYQKTDSSAHTVTITAFTGQTINGAATYILAAQYDRVTLAWDSTLRMWHIL